MRGFRFLAILMSALCCLAVHAQRVVVFPLEQEAGPPSDGWIGTGLEVALDESMTRSGVQHISLEGLRSLYDQEGLVAEPVFALPSLISLSRQLGASVLVVGSFKSEDHSVTAHLEAYEVMGDLKTLGSWDETQSLSELSELTRRLGEDLFGALGKPWIAPPKVSPQAFESYIRGRIALDPTLQEVYFRKALEIQPDYFDAKCYLAIVLKSTGRVTESTSLLVELEKESYPKAYLGLVTLADNRMEQGKITEAQRLLMMSLKARESPDAHIGLAKLYLKQGKLKEAQEELVVAERFKTRPDEIDNLRRQIQLAATPPPAPAATGSTAVPGSTSPSSAAPPPPAPAETRPAAAPPAGEAQPSPPATPPASATAPPPASPLAAPPSSPATAATPDSKPGEPAQGEPAEAPSTPQPSPTPAA